MTMKMTIPMVASCLETREALSDLADNELDARRRGRVKRHLAMCRHCRAIWKALQTTIRGLQSLGTLEPEPNPALVEAVSRTIRAEQQGRGG
ncbi:MAG TPA: zf-HC2 domain-containing protein [Gaiellaceae bacterium]|nr:zf-HC2 domain-containing protein [Gaiellaceae bacterium]